MQSRFKPVRNISLILLLVVCLSLITERAVCDDDYNIYAASYKIYDTTYDDILKMYLRVMPAQCWGSR